MNKIDWTRKLTSRKFWLSIASFVAMLLVATAAPQPKVLNLQSRMIPFSLEFFQ